MGNVTGSWPCVSAFGVRGSSVRNGRHRRYEARIHPLTASIIAFADENLARWEGNPVNSKIGEFPQSASGTSLEDPEDLPEAPFMDSFRTATTRPG
jgi:hypothetical protein